jgi:hypothetical protein
MLHSDIIPEHSCDGELIQLEEYLPVPHEEHRTNWRYEFSFEPDSDWVTIVLPRMR